MKYIINDIREPINMGSVATYIGVLTAFITTVYMVVI